MSNAYGDVRIGLEVHARLLTRHKLFCHCPASDTHGTDAETSDGVPDRANTRVCPICLGHPGTLPVLNREAVVLALRAAIACDCLLHEVSVFARKHYFYPDLPKGYQITQYDHPLATGGALRYRRADGSIGSVTLLWDESHGRGHIMREKEHALEYHYIDDPDLPPLHIPHVERQRAEHGIAELPLSRAERFERAYLLSARDADALTSEPRLADFFEELLAALQVEEHPGRLHAAVQWVGVELLRVLHRRGWDAIHITPATLALLLRHLEQGTVTRPIAKTLFDRLCISQEDATALIEAHARKPMHDAASLRGIAREVLSRHPEQCHTYRNGKKGLIGFFMRQVMEATGGSAHPAQAKEILRMLLDGDS